MVATTKFYGIDLAAGHGVGPSTTADLVEVFEFLRPKPTKAPLIRIGGNIDGAYLVPDDLDGISACFSPGVNRIKYFEDFLGDTYGIKAHMCDFTCDVSQFKTPLREGMQTFQKKWLDPEPGDDNIALGEWVDGGSSSGDLLLQMDIEGAEFRNILATPDDVLARFRVIVLEVHSLKRMTEAAVLHGAVAPFFAKLARNFTTVHAHPNNCCGDFEIPGTDIRVPNVLELTLLRNDRFVADSGTTPLVPHPLDVARNVPRKPPLFLSEAWCGAERPLESRVKMLEDTLAYREDVGASAPDSELAGVLSMLAQSNQTSTRLLGRRKPELPLVEVANGRPYTLSSAYGSSGRTGTVGRQGNYFFHTEFGASQFIKVDLGAPRRVRRIVLSNRRDGFQDRAKHLFVSLSGKATSATTNVFPAFTVGSLVDGAWETCEVAIPDIKARFVTITAPLNTALHLSDLQVFAVDETETAGGMGTPKGHRARQLVAAVRRRVERRARALARSARDR